MFSSRYNYQGRRVELNAMTSDQVVAFLDSKLVENGITRVIPDTQTLDKACRWAVVISRLNSEIKKLLPELEAEAATLKLPANVAAPGSCLTTNSTSPSGRLRHSPQLIDWPAAFSASTNTHSSPGPGSALKMRLSSGILSFCLVVASIRPGTLSTE
jgi:hypothetical protein